MFKNFRDKVALSGVGVLVIGVILLISTFIAAYGFLTQTLSIIADSDLVRTFGEALAPLIAACIHIMYLGVMGWVGSLVTIRGVTLIVNAPKLEVPVTTAVPQKPVTQPIAQPQPQVVAKPVVQPVVAQKAKTEPEKEKPKPPEVKPVEPKPQEPKQPEPKTPEPEIVVIPPDEMMPQQPQQPQTTTEKPKAEENKPQAQTT